MGRLSSRTNYQDPNIYQSKDFTEKVKERDMLIFLDWIGGMTGGELSKKYFIADITVRHRLTALKRIYEDVQWRNEKCSTCDLRKASTSSTGCCKKQTQTRNGQ